MAEQASKNWEIRKPPGCPPEWNEYIPKKNRHSESVPRGGDGEGLGLAGGGDVGAGRGVGGMWGRGESVQNFFRGE